MTVSSFTGVCLAAPSDSDAPTSRTESLAEPATLPFEAVYEAHAKFVWRVVIRLGVEPAAVEDVVQETFLAVHRGLGEFQRRSSVRTWIYGIAVNVVRHHRRARARKPLEPIEDAPDGLPAMATDPAQGPDAALERARAASLLLQVLDALPQEQREVFVLAEMEEATIPEIGEILAINPNTAASRLRAARKNFDKALACHRARDGWRGRA